MWLFHVKFFVFTNKFILSPPPQKKHWCSSSQTQQTVLSAHANEIKPCSKNDLQLSHFLKFEGTTFRQLTQYTLETSKFKLVLLFIAPMFLVFLLSLFVGYWCSWIFKMAEKFQGICSVEMLHRDGAGHLEIPHSSWNSVATESNWVLNLSNLNLLSIVADPHCCTCGKKQWIWTTAKQYWWCISLTLCTLKSFSTQALFLCEVKMEETTLVIALGPEIFFSPFMKE